MTQTSLNNGINTAIPPIDQSAPKNVETFTCAVGCFWGPDCRFGAMKGVVRTRVGYAGGTTPNPTYRNIGDHIETIQIDYDPERITYRQMLDMFWKSHNPARTVWKRQYASALFLENEHQEKLARETRDDIASMIEEKIQTEIIPLDKFYMAERYHQKYHLQGYEELMAAAKGLVGRGYDVKVVLVGDDIYRHSRSYKERLLSLVGSAGLRDRVIFTGFREDIPELLASFDIFVLPSRSEGFGRVNLEAMAMARPVISTNIGGIPEIVLDGITGILVPPGDSEALSRAITVLLDDPHLRERMGREGRRRVEKHFSLQTHVRRIQEIYDGILERARTMETSPQSSPMYYS